MFTLNELHRASDVIYRSMQPTPQYHWPQLSELAGCNVWVKHENHTPTTAFKVRGGLYLLSQWVKEDCKLPGILSATRGNHGQSLSFAGNKHGVPVTIVVPECNNLDQNMAIKSFGANLIVHGKDFEAARQHSLSLQASTGYKIVSPFERELVVGVATYAYELFNAVKDLDTVYVSVGMGSGICGLIHVRDLLGLKTEIVGVVAENAPTFKRSFDAGKIVATEEANTFADGVATRSPMSEAFEIIQRGASRIITVSEQQIAHAMYAYFKMTHNLAEGAGAVPLAGLLKEKEHMQDKNVSVVLSGGNIDFSRFTEHVSPFMA